MRTLAQRAAISRCETPSAAIALTCAHSTALRTAPSTRSELADELEAPDATGHNGASRWSTFQFLDLAQD